MRRTFIAFVAAFSLTSNVAAAEPKTDATLMSFKSKQRDFNITMDGKWISGWGLEDKPLDAADISEKSRKPEVNVCFEDGSGFKSCQIIALGEQGLWKIEYQGKAYNIAIQR